MQGRFGLYVTDGETNATLRSEDSLETLTHERAMVLLQMRRERGDTAAPTKSKGRAPKAKRAAEPRATGTESKAAAKMPAAKRAAPAAKKPAAKKPAAKKPAAKKPPK